MILQSRNLLFTIKHERQKIRHTVLGKSFTNTLVKFMQNRIKPERVVALSVSTVYQVFKKEFVGEVFKL